MSPHLFLSHLRAARWGLVAWSGLMGLYALLVFYLYPVMKEAGYEQMFEKMPESIKAMAGLQDLPSGIGLSLEAFVAAEFLSSWAAVVVIYAIFAAGGIVAREVERGTMDLILAQPLSRTRLVLSKFAVFLAGVGIIAMGSFLGFLAGMAVFDETMSLGNTALALFQGVSLVLAVGSYSLLLSCLTLDPRRTLLLSGTITAAFYILNFVAPALKGYTWAGRFSLFHYFSPEPIMRTGQPDWWGLGIFWGLALICLALSLSVFRRRDIVA
ncbi:MAG: ABC transporter permease [Chloroflexi bacterium]|nr:ABC transporter permease [Chloroflexota bacterium]